MEQPLFAPLVRLDRCRGQATVPLMLKSRIENTASGMGFLSCMATISTPEYQIGVEE